MIKEPNERKVGATKILEKERPSLRPYNLNKLFT